MTMKNILIASAVFLLGVGAVLFATDSGDTYVYPSGAAGDSYSSARIAHEGITAGTTTPVHIINNSGRDRIVTGVRYWVEDHTSGGWGTSSSTASHISLRLATSTNDAIPSSNTNFLLSNQFSTSSEPLFVASTTGALNFERRWADGDTMVFWFVDNFGTATSAPSGSTGVMGVEYFTD